MQRMAEAAARRAAASRRRRVVVTGVGLVTPLGASAGETWRRVLAGEGGVAALDEAWAAEARLPCRVAARVRLEEAQLEALGPGVRRNAAPFVHYAMAAADEALRDARWEGAGLDARQRRRTGVALGSGIGSVAHTAAAAEALARGYRRLTPHFVPSVLANMAAGHVSIAHGLAGPNAAPATACATGLHAVGDAARIVERGAADVMVAGGTEGSVDALSVAGFCRLRALSTRYNDRPGAASRPFDRERDGFVLGEGAGVLVLEELEHALARGARVYAEVAGYGMSGDASHITAPAPDGRGAASAMRAALDDAALEPRDVGYLNAHATSTPLGDAVEAAAIADVFGGGGGGGGPAVSSTKGAIGHGLGAAGSIEAAFVALALRDRVAPGTRNLEAPGDEFAALDLVAGAARPLPGLLHAMTNSFGFGGTNASLVLSRWCGDDNDGAAVTERARG